MFTSTLRTGIYIHTAVLGLYVVTPRFMWSHLDDLYVTFSCVLTHYVYGMETEQDYLNALDLTSSIILMDYLYDRGWVSKTTNLMTCIDTSSAG